jgi:hypothetical protein
MLYLDAVSTNKFLLGSYAGEIISYFIMVLYHKGSRKFTISRFCLHPAPKAELVMKLFLYSIAKEFLNWFIKK